MVGSTRGNASILPLGEDEAKIFKDELLGWTEDDYKFKSRSEMSKLFANSSVTRAVFVAGAKEPIGE